MSEVLSVSCQCPEQKHSTRTSIVLQPERSFMLCGPHLDTASFEFRAVTFFTFFSVLHLNITKWRLCLCHGILSHHSFRPGHRQSQMCSADICNGQHHCVCSALSPKTQQPLGVRGRWEVTVLYLLVVLSRSGHRCTFSKIFL